MSTRLIFNSGEDLMRLVSRGELSNLAPKLLDL